MTTSERSEEPLLKATGVKKHFELDTSLLESLLGRDRTVKAVDGVDMTLYPNETVGLVGESGCGKSTLGRTLSRLYEPTAGTIEFKGTDITEMSGKQLRRMRKNIQVIFQDPLSSLNPQKTAGQIVSKPLKIHDLEHQASIEDRVANLFEEVGLPASHMDKYPHEFSGGQRQRIGIARALAVEPDLIIADEPVTALDLSVQSQIINLLKRLQNEYDLSFLFIAHDLSVIKHVSSRVAVMYLGKIVERGPTDAIFDRPQHPYTRSLLHSIPKIQGEITERFQLEGEIPSPSNPPTGCSFNTRCPEYLSEKCVESEPELTQIEDYYDSDLDYTEVDRGGDRSSVVDETHEMACHWIGEDHGDREAQDPFDER
jgi:oligopeptide/dipeptide ABC transporter ATP-binding protein